MGGGGGGGEERGGGGMAMGMSDDDGCTATVDGTSGRGSSPHRLQSAIHSLSYSVSLKSISSSDPKSKAMFNRLFSEPDSELGRSAILSGIGKTPSKKESKCKLERANGNR